MGVAVGAEDGLVDDDELDVGDFDDDEPEVGELEGDALGKNNGASVGDVEGVAVGELVGEGLGDKVPFMGNGADEGLELGRDFSVGSVVGASDVSSVSRENEYENLSDRTKLPRSKNKKKRRKPKSLTIILPVLEGCDHIFHARFSAS